MIPAPLGTAAPGSRGEFSDAGHVHSDTVTKLAVSGLTGATTVTSRYCGAVDGGAPTSGTWLAGDYVVDVSGGFWVCTTGGTGVSAVWTFVGQIAPATPRRLGQNWTAKQTYTTTSFVATTGSDVTFTMAKDGRVVAYWVVDCNSTTAGFGAWYSAIQLNGVSNGVTTPTFISGQPRMKLNFYFEWWLLAGTTNTVRIGGNLGIAAGAFDINTNGSVGTSSVAVWVYDQ